MMGTTGDLVPLTCCIHMDTVNTGDVVEYIAIFMMSV